MSRLTPQLAQQIADRTMKVIGYNVNVMDETGRIIGSGNKTRIGQQHEGAMIAIQRRGRFDIDQYTTDTLQGVQPGTNLVIEFQQQIMGVIGITGLPEEVGKYGELVKMTAELFLEQAYLLEQAQWDKRLKEEFLLSILNGDRTSLTALAEQAKRLGIHFHIPRLVCVVEIQQQKENSRERDLTLRKIISLLDNRRSVDFVAMKSTDELVLLKPAIHVEDKATVCEGVEQILALLQKNTILPVKVSVGKTFTGIEGCMRSYESAKDALFVGKALFPEKPVYYFDDLMAESLLVPLHHTWRAEEPIGLIEHLLKQDKSRELYDTLRAFLAENGEPLKTAERLLIHRNTLRYRLNRITEITGKDPRRFHDLFQLQMALWLYSFSQTDF